jgi:hypothetical protein
LSLNPYTHTCAYTPFIKMLVLFALPMRPQTLGTGVTRVLDSGFDLSEFPVALLVPKDDKHSEDVVSVLYFLKI